MFLRKYDLTITTRVKYLFLLTAPARSSACEGRFFVADTFVLPGFSLVSDETLAAVPDIEF